MSMGYHRRFIGGRDGAVASGSFQKLLQKLAPTPYVDLTDGTPKRKIETYSGTARPKMVDMDHALISKQSVPIGTGGLICCVAMGIACRDADEHLIAHISTGSEIRRLLRLLSLYEGRGVSVALREGIQDFGVLKRAYWELSKMDLASLDILEPGPNLVVFEGCFYHVRDGQALSYDWSGCSGLVALAPPPSKISIHSI